VESFFTQYPNIAAADRCGREETCEGEREGARLVASGQARQGKVAKKAEMRKK